MAHLKQRFELRSPPYEPLSRLTIVLHWLVAAGVIAMLMIGLKLWFLPSGPDKNALIPLHKSIGVIVGVLAVVRVGLRLYEGFPRPISKIGRAYEAYAARLVQTALLAMTLLLPLSGIAKSLSYARAVSVFGFQVIPQLLTEKNEAWHEAASLMHMWAAIILMVFLAAHICAAVWHHIGRGNETLLRMLGRRRGIADD